MPHFLNDKLSQENFLGMLEKRSFAGTSTMMEKNQIGSPLMTLSTNKDKTVKSNVTSKV